MNVLETTTPGPNEALPQDRFGKYRLVKKLAAGGMAQIYLAAIDGPDGFSKTCVIKKVLPEYVDRDDFSEMFVNEAKVAALLNHPNIIQVYDFGKLEDQYYLAMEYLHGPSLESLMIRAARQKQALGPKLAVHMGIPLCDALTYLQHMTLPTGEPLNLVHRDITPGNVLLSRTAEIKLTDFGVVKSAASSSSTQAGVVKGKFAYMSPEQALGEPLDHRSDIFSLAVVLYEVATGKRLWKRGTPMEIITAVIKGPVPLPTTLVPGFPVPLEKILLKALEKDPKDRYPSARDMLEDLDAFRQSQGWSGGRRELSHALATYFPELQSSNLYTMPQSQVSAIPEVTSQQARERSTSSISGPRFVPEPEPIVLEDIEEVVGSGIVEEDELVSPGLSKHQRDILIALAVAMVVSLFFWFFVVS